jgi:hypothetical protein
MLQATSRSNYTRCRSPLCRVYHIVRGEITIKSLRPTALLTGWRGIWMRRLTSAIVLGSYQACCSVCPVEESANSILPPPHIGPSRFKIITHRHTIALSSPQATSHFWSANRHRERTRQRLHQGPDACSQTLIYCW